VCRARPAGQLAFDAALPAVRVAVLEGLQLLVDNQHAQPVLKVCACCAGCVRVCLMCVCVLMCCYVCSGRRVRVADAPVVC
jgi:hypothetical protein